MELFTRPDPNDLTDKERDLLASNRVPPEIKAFMRYRKDGLGERVSLYRKVAADARAEADALLAVRDLQAAQGEIVSLTVARERIATLERRARALEATVTAKDREIETRTAVPALAVHSDD